MNTPIDINGGNCGSTRNPKPCTGIDLWEGPPLGVPNVALLRNNNRLANLALYGAPETVFVALAPRGFEMANVWVGLDPFGTVSGANLRIEADDAVIGGRDRSDRNVIAGHLTLSGADRARVLGNYIGLMPDGSTPVPDSSEMPLGSLTVEHNSVDADQASGVRVGGSLSRRAARSRRCDGGCNAIAARGVALLGERGRMLGNYVGLSVWGADLDSDRPFASVHLRGTANTVGGFGARKRNVITGGGTGVDVSAATDASVVGNYIGLDHRGRNELDPPVAHGIKVEDTEGPWEVRGNHIAVSSELGAAGLRALADEGTVLGNRFNVARDGSALPQGGDAIFLDGDLNVIGSPRAGNVIGNVERGILLKGDLNSVRGNLIGVDGTGRAHPIDSGPGIQIGFAGDEESANNTIGGNSTNAENEISNTFDPILAVGGIGTRILRNSGRGNSGLFFDIYDGDLGFGNSGAVNGGIDAPTITTVRRGRAAGTGEPGAKLHVFRTRGPAGASPSRLDGFLGSTTANVAGEWELDFDRIPEGFRVTASQLSPSFFGSSEYALAVAP